MLMYYIFKQIADRQRQIEINTRWNRIDTKHYAFCISFLERKIKYYKEMNYPKGTVESVEWVEHYIHYVHCKKSWQSKMDKLATELILLTFEQSDIYKLYNYQKRFGESLSIEKFLLEQRMRVPGLKRDREFAIKIEKLSKPTSVSERELNKAIEREEKIKERNKKEQSLIESLSQEKKDKINAVGKPTFDELFAQGCLENLFSGEYRANVAVHCKIYGHYYLVVSSIARARVTNSNFLIIPYNNREDAINDMEKYFREEIELCRKYKEEQLKQVKKLENQINNTIVDISNVTKAMGLTKNDEDLNGDIF